MRGFAPDSNRVSGAFWVACAEGVDERGVPEAAGAPTDAGAVAWGAGAGVAVAVVVELGVEVPPPFSFFSFGGAGDCDF